MQTIIIICPGCKGKLVKNFNANASILYANCPHCNEEFFVALNKDKATPICYFSADIAYITIICTTCNNHQERCVSSLLNNDGIDVCNNCKKTQLFVDTTDCYTVADVNNQTHGFKYSYGEYKQQTQRADRKTISLDDITNLKIALQTTKSFDDFLNLI